MQIMLDVCFFLSPFLHLVCFLHWNVAEIKSLTYEGKLYWLEYFHKPWQMFPQTRKFPLKSGQFKY